MLSNGQVGRVKRLADQHTPPTNKASHQHSIPDPSFDGKNVLGPPAAKAAVVSKHEELTAGWARSAPPASEVTPPAGAVTPGKAATAANPSIPAKAAAAAGQTPAVDAGGAANPTVSGKAGKAPVAVERASPEDLSDFAAQWKRGGK